MKKFLNKLLLFFIPLDILKKIVNHLINYFKLGYKIGWQNAYHDLFSVSRKLWLFSIFQIFGALAFVLLSQGKDVLQCLLEDMYGNKWIPVFTLMAGTWFWSLAGEFGARMLLYLTDSSNNGITYQREEFRKQTQKVILGTQAVFPFILYLFAITQTFIHHYEGDVKITCLFTVLILLLLLELRVALNFYFGKKRATNIYFVPEKKFQQKIISNLGNILLQKRSLLNEFPEEITPDMYEIVERSEQSKDLSGEGEIKLYFKKAFPIFYKWTILYAMFTLTLFLLIGFAFNEKAHYKMGTSGIMAIGFTCWLVSFFMLKIFELTKPFEKKLKFLNLPYTSLALIWVLIVSYVNDDHPIYFNEGCCEAKPKLGPKEYLNTWYAYHKDFLDIADSVVPVLSTTFHGSIKVLDTLKRSKHIIKVPILFINSEGGALRTGSFTSLLLGGIQDKYPKFKNRIFAYSTVSGGTFGANLFNSTAYESDLKNDSLLPLYRDYYEQVDFLAPVAAKLFFGDFINYFLPVYVQKLDREVALETAWRNSWRNYLSNSDTNRLYNNFYHSTKTDGSRPAVFINSTVVESGNRAIISNMRMDPAYFKNVFDLNEKIKNNISYATAISLSARFPLVSPAGKLQIDDTYKVHLVDGGYFDNQGGTTMLELLNGLSFDPATDSIQIIPYVLQTVFDSHKQDDNTGVSMLNEITEIITGIYQTRSGHTIYANIQLQEKIKKMGGRYLELPVASTPEEVPNNWILSTYAVEHAYTRVSNLLKGTGEPECDILIKFLEQCCNTSGEATSNECKPNVNKR